MKSLYVLEKNYKQQIFLHFTVVFHFIFILISCNTNECWTKKPISRFKLSNSLRIIFFQLNVSELDFILILKKRFRVHFFGKTQLPTPTIKIEKGEPWSRPVTSSQAQIRLAMLGNSWTVISKRFENWYIPNFTVCRKPQLSCFWKCSTGRSKCQRIEKCDCYEKKRKGLFLRISQRKEN